MGHSKKDLAHQIVVAGHHVAQCIKEVEDAERALAEAEDRLTYAEEDLSELYLRLRKTYEKQTKEVQAGPTVGVLQG